MQPILTRARPGFIAFDAIAESYDQVFTNTGVGRAQRDAVWRQMDRAFHPGQRILEINCGTGIDAVHLAQRGVQVVACDISAEMIHAARRNVETAGVQHLVEFVELQTEHIFMLGKNFQFDGLLSNFGGLNCSQGLKGIASDLAALLKPRARAFICVFSSFCAWETLWYLSRWKPRKAFRRMHSVTDARVGGDEIVRVFRHSVRNTRQAFSPYFKLRRFSGVGIFVPPSYVDTLADRFPGMLSAAERVDSSIARFPVLRSMADHILMEFERTEVCPP